MCFVLAYVWLIFAVLNIKNMTANDKYSIVDGLKIKMYYLEQKFSHVKEIEGRPSDAGYCAAKRSGGEAMIFL